MSEQMSLDLPSAAAAKSVLAIGLMSGTSQDGVDVALIDTEGQKAIDVFYLTERGKKLSQQKQELLREVLQSTLS